MKRCLFCNTLIPYRSRTCAPHAKWLVYRNEVWFKEFEKLERRQLTIDIKESSADLEKNYSKGTPMNEVQNEMQIRNERIVRLLQTKSVKEVSEIMGLTTKNIMMIRLNESRKEKVKMVDILNE